MAIRNFKIDNVFVIALEGRFMAEENHRELRQMVEDHLSKGHKNMIIDFSDLEWIDSAGIGVIISAHVTTVRQGGDLRMASLSLRVRHYFQLSGLDNYFNVFESQDAAVASFQT